MEKTSGTLIPIILWMSLLLGLAIPAHAFFPPRVDVSHNPELSANLGKVLGNHWFERKRRILTGEDRLGTKELDAIYQAQLDRGIRNIPLLSFLMVRESLRALDGNDLKKAEVLCQYAKKFAPDYPPAHFTMGKIFWSRSKTLVNLVLQEYLRGLHAILTNFRTLFYRSLNFVYLISGALLLTFIAFTVVMGLKYLSLYVHDVKKEFDLAPMKLVVSLVKLFAFIVPVLLQFNLLWTLFYWAILMWGYLARRERQMLIIFLFVLVYVPWGLKEATVSLQQVEPEILMSLYEANEENGRRDTRKRFKNWSQERPEDRDILFTLGLLHKREGSYKEAERYYRETLEYDPNWPECISNLGNIYLITDRLEEAIEQYERAVSLSPKKCSFYFNLHRAFAKDSVLSSEKLGQALQMANKLDSGLVAFYTQIYSENKNRSVIDDTIAMSRLWNRLSVFFQRRYALPEGVVKAWLRGVPGKYAVIYPIFFLVFLALFALLSSKGNFSKQCPMCGTPSVKFFTRKIQRDMVCFGCNRLFVKKDSIDPRMKDKKMKQVARFEKRKTILRTALSLILPGGGHLWKDQLIKGSLFVFFFFVFGLKFLYWNGMVHDSMALGGSPGFWSRFVFILFFLLYYFAVLRSSFRIES